MQMRGPITAILLLAPMRSPAADLGRSAKLAFESYATDLENRLARQHAHPDTCIAMLAGGNARPGAERELLEGALLVEPLHHGNWDVDGGLLHHWRGLAFVPEASSQDMLAVLRGYGQFSRYFAPEVVSTQSAAGSGSVLIRLKKQLVVSVVLDAQFETQSHVIDNCGSGFSRSTHVWQVDEVGTAHERRRPEGADDGFLWRLNSYWSFEEWHNGLLIECEAVCLTRGIPPGLGWLLSPIIQTLPRKSLESTLAGTKNALADSVARRQINASAN